MVTMPTASTLATALPEIIPNSAEPNTAILAAPPRKFPIAAIERSEKKSTPPVRQHLAQNRERDHDDNGYLQDRPDRAIDIETEIDHQPFRRYVTGLKIAGQMRADVDVDRHRQDDADKTPPRGAPAGFQNKKNEDGADDQAIERKVSAFERQGLVTGRDVTAQND